MHMKKRLTKRGFRIIEFKDDYDANCSLQESSSAEDDKIWLGIHNTTPRILVSNAEELGIKTTETCGWIDYPLPEEVFISTRMHLTREQTKELIKELQVFVDTGELSNERFI